MTHPCLYAERRLTEQWPQFQILCSCGLGAARSISLTLDFDTGTLYALRYLLYLSLCYHELGIVIDMSLVPLARCVWYSRQSPLVNCSSRHFSILGTNGLATVQSLAERASLPSITP